MATFGCTTQGPGATGFGAEYFLLARFELAETGSLQSLSAYLWAAGSVSLRAVVYGDASGPYPGSLIAKSSSQYGLDGGTALYSFPLPPSVQSAGWYWLGLVANGSWSLTRYTASYNSITKYVYGGFGSPPSTFPSGGTAYSGYLWSVYATYLPIVFDESRWKLFPHQLYDTGVWTMEEGVRPAERSRDTSATRTVSCGTTGFTTVASYKLPLPPDGILRAGTYGCLLRCWGIAASNHRVTLSANGGATLFSSSSSATPASESTVWFQVTVGSDTAVSSLNLLYEGQGVSTAKDVSIRPVHADVAFGCVTNGCGRSTFGARPLVLAQGSHAVPTLISNAQPALSSEFTGVYADDTLVIRKYADTARSATHNPTGAVDQAVGLASAVTTAFPAACTRRIALAANAEQLAVPLLNTYYEVRATDPGGNLVGSMAYELLLRAQPATLTSLNGGSAATRMVTTALEPILTWSDPNDDTTSWRVKVYRASDDALMWDSGETAAGDLSCQIPSAAGLADLTTYYAVLTLMSGSGGSNWSMEVRGYFAVDGTSTALKITSHEGESDDPEVIATRAPSIVWTFPKTQVAYEIAVHAAAGTLIYSTGWVASSAGYHDLPADTLAWGETCSVQVRVKDAQQNIYTCDKRAWLHVNQVPSAPTPTDHADVTTHDPVTLTWTPATAADGDTETYDVELENLTTGAVSSFTGLASASLLAGRLPVA